MLKYLKMLDNNKYFTPKEIVAELDKYIIGQNDAKRNVAIALRNRWRRMNAKPEIRQEIMPNNILMIGATGVGKTEIARRLANIADAEKDSLALRPAAEDTLDQTRPSRCRCPVHIADLSC